MFYYSSSSPDAPKLRSVYGDFNRLINYIIDGGSEISVTKIEPSADNKVKIWYDQSLSRCPWGLSQTIAITSGSTYYTNFKFFIEAIDEANKYVVGYNTRVETNSQIETAAITAKITPSGITRVFGGVDDKRTVFKFAGANSLEYRIDDRDFGPLLSSPITTNDNWIKVARLSCSEKYENIDFTSNRILPYNPSRPTENFIPSGDYIGQMVIPYATNSTGSQTYITNSSYSTYSQYVYKIWADKNGILIQIGIESFFYSRFFYMGNFDQVDKSVKNGYIQACYLRESPYNNSGGMSLQLNVASRAPSFLHQVSTDYAFSHVFNDSRSNTTPVYFRGEFAPGGGAPSGTRTNGVTKLAAPNVPDLGFYYSDTLLVSDDTYYGKLYNIKWVNTVANLSILDSISNINNDVYMWAGYNYGGTDDSSSKFMIKLTRE